MSKKYTIGVMGCANIATRSVIPAIKQLSGQFEVAAIASRDRSKAEPWAKEFGCDAVEGYDALLNDDSIDAIYMPLPTGLHYEWIIKALKAGKHVYGEKSLAMSYEDSLEMIDIARENNLALMEGFMFQYHSQHSIVFDLLNKGEIGGIRNFRSSFGFPPLPKDNFRYDEAVGGGVLYDAAGYPVRAAYFILGDEFKVTSGNLYFDEEAGTYMYGSAQLDGANGVSAQLSFGFDNYYQCNYEIWGSKGRIRAERAFTPRPDFQPTITLETAEGTKSISADCDNHFVNAFAEFHSLIDGGNKERHYKDILLQSKALSDIKQFAQDLG